ncbi:MAG: acetate--CoA ligase family protein [Candidatus Aenigmatarchaeota archaeon]
MKKLPDSEALRLIKKYKIPFAETLIAKNERQAALYARRIGYPVCLKISSPDIIHKFDSGAIALGIMDEKSLVEGFRKVVSSAKRKNPKTRIDGVLVQKFVPNGNATELVVGAKVDPQFGPVVMFGLGGIFVEVMKDVSFRLAPIERKDAQEMIREIKGYKILQGARGRKPANLKAIEGILLSVSKMIWANQKKIRELDLNPVFADDKKCIAVDIRVMTD